MRARRLLEALLVGTLGLCVPQPALATVADDAAVVLVRQSCTGLQDCFESMDVLSNPSSGWIWTTRRPDASAPLLVDVGPGTFGGFTCPLGEPRNGHVTLRGSGREQTILLESGRTVDVTECEKLAFIDLGVHGSTYAVYWSGLGDATWTNVDFKTVEPGGSYNFVWVDTCPNETSGNRSLHYFFGSRLATERSASGTFNIGFFSSCAESWFFGGELAVKLDASGGAASGTVFLSGNADFRAFGTAIRAFLTEPNPTADLTAVRLQGSTGQPDPVFHMHGGIINASAELGRDATALKVDAGLAHTPATAYVVTAGAGGTATRVVTTGTGVARVPFLWESGTLPPTSSDETNVVVSEDGKDVFVETDCGANGDCSGGGSEAHLMVYNPAACPQSIWLDVVTGRCRNDTGQ